MSRSASLGRFTPQTTTVKTGPNRGEVLEELDAKRSNLNLLVVLSGFIGFMTGMIANEILYSHKYTYPWSCVVFQFFCTISTVWLVFLLLKAYMVEFEMLEISGKTVAGTTFFKAFSLSKLYKPCIRDVLVCAIHPAPFINGTVSIWGMGKYFPYTLTTFFTLCMIVRLWVLFPRFITETSGLRNEKTRLVGLLNNVNVSNRFIMKHLLNDSLIVLGGLSKTQRTLTTMRMLCG